MIHLLLSFDPAWCIGLLCVHVHDLDMIDFSFMYCLIFTLFVMYSFPRPILHGLCSLGFAVRAVIKCICKGNSDMVKSLSGRFLLHVFPGETLITEMWLEGLRYDCYLK